MIDNNLTIKIKEWLEKDSHTDEEIINGATMLLKLNRNRNLFQTVLRRPKKFESKIRYELNKFLPMRLAQMTLADVKVLDAEITPTISAAVAAEPATNEGKSDEDMDLPAHTGKRPDHDSLPENIKNIWTTNAERWKKIKETYNTCKTLTQPCDRYEHLTILKDLWYQYKSDFVKYDSYVIEKKKEETSAPAPDPLQVAKDINNARSYITKNIDALLDARKEASSDKATEDAISKYQSLLEKIKERWDLLIANKSTIGEDITKKLEEGCAEIKKDEDTGTTTTAQ